MTFEEVSQLALSVFPNAEILLDNDGQWIVYTNIEERN